MKHASLEMIALVHDVLAGHLDVVFVGGATIPLYVSEERYSELRATDDVDCVVQVTSRLGYYEVEAKLRARGFQQRVDAERSPACRWWLNQLVVDVMPVAGEVLGFVNRWYALGVDTAVDRTLPNGSMVRVFRPGVLLASKIEAYDDRGRKDPLVSPDLEDIVTLLDACEDLEEDIGAGPPELAAYVGGWAQGLLGSRDIGELIEGHLGGTDAEARAGVVLARLRRIAGNASP